MNAFLKWGKLAVPSGAVELDVGYILAVKAWDVNVAITHKQRLDKRVAIFSELVFIFCCFEVKLLDTDIYPQGFVCPCVLERALSPVSAWILGMSGS